MTKTIMIAAAIASGLVCDAFSQGSRLSLTPEQYTKAVQEGQTDKRAIPLSLLASKVSRVDFRLTTTDRWEGSDVKRLLNEAPFEVYVLTPYTRVLATSADAKRRFAEMPQLNVDALNSDGVIVSVTTPASFIDADSVETVVIKRGDIVVRPFRSDVTPRTIKNAAGASRSVNGGAFHFNLAEFDRFPFDLVCVGKSRNYILGVFEEDVPR